MFIAVAEAPQDTFDTDENVPALQADHDIEMYNAPDWHHLLRRAQLLPPPSPSLTESSVDDLESDHRRTNAPGGDGIQLDKEPNEDDIDLDVENLRFMLERDLGDYLFEVEAEWRKSHCLLATSVDLALAWQ